MQHRLDKLRQLLRDQKIDAMVIQKPENRCYFSGFTGSAGLLVVTEAVANLITDFRYVEQAGKQAPLYEVVRHGPNIYETLGERISSLNIKRIGFEADFVTWDGHSSLANNMKGCELLPQRLDPLRMVKDADELAHIRKAVDIADKAFSHIIDFIKPGLREVDVAIELEFCMRRLGAEKTAFDIIVASGVRSSLPHGRASEKVIETGDFVTMDFGAVYNGYHSDITRTVVIGQASGKQKEIYHIVQEAQLLGLKAVQAGRFGKDVDDVARKVITEAGYGQFFGHGLGHGLGLVIHEDPRLSPMGNIVLEANMTVTVEPGIYLPDWGGVRIEDTVVVTAAGCEILTASSKQLIELDR